MIKRLIVSLMICFITINLHAQDTVGCLPDDAFHTWQVVEGKCASSWSFTVKVNIHYPEYLDSYPFAKTLAMQYLDMAEEDFVQLSASALRDPLNPYALNIDYQVYNYSDAIQTILFLEERTMGRTNPNTRLRTMTFDFRNNRLITLDDLFNNTILGLNQSAFLLRKANFMAHPFGSLDAWFFNGTEPTTDNFHAFVLAPDALVFFFAPYQVSPSSIGVQNAGVPWTDLRDLLKEEFRR